MPESSPCWERERGPQALPAAPSSLLSGHSLGFLNLGTVDIIDYGILRGGGFPIATLSPRYDNQLSPDMAKCPLGGKTTPT